MQPLLAQLTTDARASDNRGAVRRSLRLEVRASPDDASSALIRNLSERGLLIETAAELAIGETIHVDLPEAGTAEARIMWRDGPFFGCEFLTPVSKAAVSAALLLAPVERAPVTALPSLPANAVFGDELERPEPELEAYSPGTNAVLMASLVVALIMTLLFITALLTFPFSI
jgi:hypothetical protein